MSKLVKAEWYRAMHSGAFFPVLMVTGLLPIALSLASASEMEEFNFFSLLVTYSQGAAYTVSGIVSVVMSAMISNMYQNRTYYYEIMNGESTHRIILSKLVVYNGIATFIVIIPAIILFSVTGFVKGMGDMQEPLLLAALGCVIVINNTCATILVSMLIRHIFGGPGLLYCLNCLISLVYMLLEEMGSSGVFGIIKRIIGFLPAVQFMELAGPEYSASFIVKIIGGFIVSFALLYSLTYLSYKKKKFR